MIYKRVLWVVENDNDKMIKFNELKTVGDKTSILVVDYGGWDFLIPDMIYLENSECFQRFFDQCNDNTTEEWTLVNTLNYPEYTWVRYVHRASDDDLERFISCIPEYYEIIKFPPEQPKKPSGAPKPKPPKPRPTADQLSDWKKRAAHDYD